ncbi:MAG: hypothetical protein GY773_01605, partial [Actinomycetia bacterium]|nr:hypothetical protein [Actinomycetes bacterium]
MGKLTFAKVMIGLCLVGSGVLAWFDWKQYQEIERLEVALEPGGEVETLVRDTQRLGKEYAELEKALGNEALMGQSSPLTYISEMAERPKIGIGNVDISPSERPTSNRATVDKVYTITPSDKKRNYDQLSIANYLYSLEENSRRIRVTMLKIDQL